MTELQDGNPSKTPPSLIGYQEHVDWMGERVLTLRDLWPEEPRAMIVGLNPAPPSVAVGHYYQGRSGQRQLRRLVEHGVFPLPRAGTYFEEEALVAGTGFTDLVKRPTVGEDGVSAAELHYGRELLESTLAKRGVVRVICVFRQPVIALLGQSVEAGWQPQRTTWGAQVFRMPGPFERREVVARVMRTLHAAR